jgi:hypothetical protein
MQKKAAGRAKAPAKRRKVKGALLAAFLVLPLASLGAAFALLGPERAATSRGTEPATSSAAPAAAALQSQNPFSPSSPSKEYVYAGGRLVATEEPARLDQTITFNQPPDKTYGAAPFTLSASSTSGLPVSFTVTSGPATVSGSTVTITGAGGVTVEADQSGNTSYNPAPAVSRTFNVAKATPTITWSDPTGITYGAALGATQLNASASTPGSLSYTPASGAVLHAGAQTLHVDFTPTDTADYNTASKDVTLLVSKSALTVTAQDKTRAYGDANPPLTYLMTGFVNGDTQSGATTGQPSLSTAATTSSAVGTYAITASAGTLASSDYSFSLAGGTLTVTKADQTISFAALGNKTFGDADFTVSATASSGLPVSFAAAGGCTVSGTTVHITGAGTCTVTASQGGDSNHNAAADVSQPLAIAKAASTTTVTAADAVYDTGTHGGTASASGAGGLSQSLTVSYSGRAGTSYGPTATAPTNAGDYTASASYGGDANHNSSSGSKDFTIAKAQTTIALSNLTQSYDSTPRVVTAATVSPSGLSGVTVTYNGSTMAPVNVGSYSISATLSNANYTAAAATGTLVVNKGTATVTLGGLTGQVYDGTAKSATATTTPAGLTVNIAYAQNGSGVTSPTGAGSYDVTATVNDASYQGGATGTLVISKASATLALGNLTGHTYNGSPQVATASTTPAGLSGVTITYGGSTTAPTAAGSYRVAASLTNANYSATTVSGTMTVAKATPAITWSDPADIAAGTALSSTQLNAAANTAGAFTYTPAAGTVLGVGNAQALSASFAPTDATDYNTASATAHIYVIGCPASGSSTFAGTTPILKGSSSTLSWNVPYATGVTIGGVAGTFAASGSTSVTPSATTTYTLTATGASVCSNMTKQTTVVVNTSCPRDSVTSFSASPDTLTAGGSTTLSWSSPGATHVRVYVGDSCQPGDSSCELFGGSQSSGSITLSPSETTTYDFEATGTPGCTPLTGQAAVTVLGDPATCSPNATFTTTPSSGGCDGSVTISWSVPNAMSVNIGSDGPEGMNLGYFEGPPAQSGQITVSLTGTTSFTLDAQLLTIASEGGSTDNCGEIQLHTTHTCP